MSFSVKSARLRELAEEWTLERCVEVLDGDPDGVTRLLAVALGGASVRDDGRRVVVEWTEEEQERLAVTLGVRVVVRTYVTPGKES